MILRLKAYTADIVGCMFACAHLTNTSLPALLGDADADAYEILFSFASPEENRQLLDLIRANEDLGNTQQGAFDDVLQFPNVARPVIAPEQIQRLLAHTSNFLSGLLGVAVHQVFSQQRDRPHPRDVTPSQIPLS